MENRVAAMTLFISLGIEDGSLFLEVENDSLEKIYGNPNT